MNRTQRLLRKVLAVQTNHPRMTVLIGGLLALLSIIYTSRNLEFQTGQIDLISPGNRLVKLSEKIDFFDKLDRFVVAIESENPGQSLKFLHALVLRLQKDHGKYLQIFYRVDPDQFKQWQLLYLSKKELSTLKNTLEDHEQFLDNLTRIPGLDQLLTEINREMASSMVGELFTGFLNDNEPDSQKTPLDLTFLIRLLEQMKDSLNGNPDPESPWDAFFESTSGIDSSEEGYFWTDDKKYLLLFVTPEQEENSFSGALDSLTSLRYTLADVRHHFRDVSAGVTGLKALNQDEMGTALHDMTLATFLSLGLLALLLVLFWRGFKKPLFEIIELLLALSWTFGLTTLFIGHLNILSVTFAPLLLGLGIDYGIHWLARYQEVMRSGVVSKHQAMETVMTQLGPGIILAGLTAALSFFPLVLTGFKGLQELGLIAAMGMVMTTITTLGILPALVMLWDKPKSQEAESVFAAQRLYLLELTNGRGLAILITGVLALAGSLWAARNVAFDLNMLHLQSRSTQSVIWERKLINDSEISSMYGAVLAHSLAEVKKKTAALKALPTVSEVQSVETLLPEHQMEKLTLLHEMKPLLSGISAVRPVKGPVDLNRLKTILGRIRFKMANTGNSDWETDKAIRAQMDRVRNLIGELTRQFQTMDNTLLETRLGQFQHRLLEDLIRKLAVLRDNFNARPMGIQDLPGILRERFVDPNGLYLIRVLPKHNIWEPRYLGPFVKDMLFVDPDAIGDPVTLYVFTKAFRDASIKAAVYAVVFIVILLLATFRSLRDVLWVMLPLIVGTAWTFGLMGVFGIDLNLANSIFLPLVVGAGVEYGIIFMQRFRQEDSHAGTGVKLPVSTIKGIVLAGLTTTVGFGSLAISNHRGIQSLGLLAMVGSLSILAAAVLFLPGCLQVAGWVKQHLHKNQRPPAGPGV